MPLTYYPQKFTLRLKRHLWSRLSISRDQEEPRSSFEIHCQVSIRNDKVYPSNGMRVHYTAYDTTKAFDYIAADKHANVMISARTGTQGLHAYACVLGLFHLYARNGSQEAEKLEVAWIQYYDVVDEDSVGGRCYPKLRLSTGHDSFGFIDPQEIIRGCHIIPDFASGMQLGCQDKQTYKYYFVNM